MPESTKNFCYSYFLLFSEPIESLVGGMMLDDWGYNRDDEVDSKFEIKAEILEAGGESERRWWWTWKKTQ